MNNKIKQLVTLSFAIFSIAVMAKENVPNPGVTSVVNTRVAAGCNPSKSQTDLDVNNVRTTIMGGGDMWWNLADAQYEIPKGGNKHSMFAGALWIGGVDDGGQLKVAAMTYRQDGNDFWPGPLNVANATISADECIAWDKHFKLDRLEVEEYVARFETDPTYVIPTSILEWPAHGDASLGQEYFLAPFHDANENGIYEPYDGDYPDYNITGNNKDAKLFGDQTLFWIFNDKGNIHTETEAEPLGLEIHAQAFGFTADNELNDMTFYNYKVINRSTLPLNDTYFGQWVDPDLGYYLDDFVGCDVGLGLGYCYNGDAEDEGGAGYGFNPPAIGVDFFQGPLADPNDGVDNDRDGEVDEEGEQIIMSKFVYYNNDFTETGNPESGTDIYNYLRGIWKDNVPMTYGGDGHGGGIGTTTDECNYMFPNETDTVFSTPWTEVTATNEPADRRFLQSAGPFTLHPGAVNEITTGVVWARAVSGGPSASVELLKVYDRTAQALFNNNFDIINGPDAPDVTVRELDKELIFTLSNGSTSNNIDESYSEKDPFITNPVNIPSNVNYEFQGYLVYQLKDATVSATDLDNPDKARLIYRSDVNDGVSEIVNHYKDPSLGGGVWLPVQEVSGTLSDGVIGSVDEGIEFSFQISDDRFALGNSRLVNHKTYYFMSLAYGFNSAEINEDPYSNAFVDPDFDGRNRPYLQGRRNIKVYSAIPHINNPKNGGTTLNSSYGDGVELTRLEGKGNGGLALELTTETVEEILNSEDHRSFFPTYEQGQGPVSITVVDPVKIPKGDYTFKLMNPIINAGAITSYGKWELSDNEDGSLVASDNQDIDLGSEQYISQLGLNVKVIQTQEPGADPTNIDNNGLISGSIEFSNINDRWLSGVADRDDENGFVWGLNWIRAGSHENENIGQMSDYGLTDDINGAFEGAVMMTNRAFGGMEWTGGTWAPYRFASHFNDGPGISSSITNLAKLANLNSVDIVFTKDTAKWTRVCVVEAQDDATLAEGNQVKMGLRKSRSVDKLGVSAPGYSVNGNMLTMQDSSFYTLEPNALYSWDPASQSIDTIFPDSLLIIEYNNQLDPNLATDTIFGFEVSPFTYIFNSTGDIIDSISYENTSFVNSQVGMGWFPGYAIDVETGERLNIIFSEDSWQTSENGNDMIWNPTSTLVTNAFPQYDPTAPVGQQFSGGNYLLGGKHFIYVVKGNAWVKGTEDYINGDFGSNKNKNAPNYDEGYWIYNKLNSSNILVGQWEVFKNVSWVGAPLLASGKELLTSDATVKLRVSKPYKQYETVTEDKFYSKNDSLTEGETYVVAYETKPLDASQIWGGFDVNYFQIDTIFSDTISDTLIVIYPIVEDTIVYIPSLIKDTIFAATTFSPGESFFSIKGYYNFTGSAKARVIEGRAVNSYNPTYSFSTDGIVAVTGDKDVAKTALDIINVVPNPYYGYSSYEVNQLDNRVKITNLPRRATIKIFTVSGTEVRTLNKDNSMTSIDWDLKNNFGIPIASGLYVIHINAPGVGEKVIKWFGALRPIDLDTF